MRKVTAWAGLGVLVLAIGCNHLMPTKPTETGGTQPAPKVADLVSYLNDNAKLVQGVQCNTVAIDCKQGNQPFGLDGMMACQKPRNFRLAAKILGQPGVDIGSNDDEFWYWIKEDKPPYVYHCSYKELANPDRKVTMPFPFQPDMVVAALGMAEYDPTKNYELKVNPKTLELSEPAVSLQGKPIRKVTIFNRSLAAVSSGQPQVVGYVLKDDQGKDICAATVYAVQVDKRTRAVLPRHIKLVWPEQKLEMTMRFTDLQAVDIDARQQAALFRRDNLKNLTAYDLSRNLVDNAPGTAQGMSLQKVRGSRD
jgi:hypothetical protein